MKTAVLLNDTSLNRHHGCHLVSGQIERLAGEAGIRIVARSRVGADWRNDAAFRAAMDGVDLVLVNGEGTLHSSKPYALPVVQVAGHARALGKPAFLINSIWQKNDERFVAAARDFTGIWVRESTSRAELAASGLEAGVVPDLTLSSDPPPACARSGLLFNDSNRRDVTTALYRRMSGEPGTRWLSILTPPTADGPTGRRLASWGAWLAYTTLYRVYRPAQPGIRAYNYTGAHNTVAGMMASVAGAEGVITGRFHAVCFCLLTDTPFLAVPSSSHKIEAMLTDAGLAQRVLPSDRIADLDFARLLPFTAEEKAKVQAFRAHARQSAQEMFARIRAACG